MAWMDRKINMKNITEWKLTEGRLKRRSRKRFEDFKKMGVKNWNSNSLLVFNPKKESNGVEELRSP